MPRHVTLPADPLESARAAGLRYVSDSKPGIRREPEGKSFGYYGPDGKRLCDEDTLARIRSLVIPPAWREVWICPSPKGHLQATGRDARGRKQYRYHPLYRAVRDQLKYSRMAAFGEALPRIRENLRRDLSLPGVPRNKVLATIVRLLESTSIRVGNEEYVKQNDSYGLTTLRSDHAEISGSKILFHFRGKSGKNHQVQVSDPRIARIVKRCQELPGEELFHYMDEDGELRTIGSEDVNEYLREITGEDFTAKDFRTWNGTVLAAAQLCECDPPTSETGTKKAIVAVVKQVAERLGNRPATCRKYYLHPAVLESFTAGELIAQLKPAAPAEASAPAESGLSPLERRVLKVLRQDLKQLRPAA